MSDTEIVVKDGTPFMEFVVKSARSCNGCRRYLTSGSRAWKPVPKDNKGSYKNDARLCGECVRKP